MFLENRTFKQRILMLNTVYFIRPGKTLLARAVAHHTECTFIRVSGSELVQKFIGKDIVVRIGIRKEAM